MKPETVSGMAIGLVLAIVGALIFLFWWVGAETMRIVVYVMSGSVSAALVLLAVAVIIRSYRKRDGQTTHHVHDGTKTVIRERVIDQRPAPPMQFPQLPAPHQGNFSEVLRAAFIAGNQQASVQRGDVVDSTARDVTDDESGWDGAIYP